MSDRDDKDFAIEFAEYLADAAERFLMVVNNNRLSPADVSYHWHALQNAAYEFRKRAARAK